MRPAPIRILLAAAFALCAAGCAGRSAGPAAEAPVTRILVASCQEETEPSPLMEQMAREDADLALLIGDNVYGDAESGDMSLPELRQAYADLARHPAYLALTAAVPVETVYDDHDFGMNDAGADFAGRETAERLFEDFFELPPDDPRRARPGVYHAFTLGPEGRRVQVILLDTRYFRDPLTPTDQRDAPGRERYIPYEGADRTMLGEAQWAWLADALSQPADVRLLVSSIQVVADGHGFEAWRMLPRERERLYRLIAESGARGVVLLSGDRHRAGLYRLDGAASYPLYEMTASSLNRPIENAAEEAGPNRLGPTFTGENYGVVDIDWASRTLRLTVRSHGDAAPLTQSIRFAEIEAAR